ncbi:HNH endonuclease [Bradyrhizobium sp. INPA03-11B]|uniref:HNH endonuclease n=1 Tax=Bradyrhizobium sp. INPA03-11B TaxID=418598 RepID=UPI00338FBDDE
MAPLVPKADGRTVQVQPKQVDPHYSTARHAAWAEQVKANAGYRCEWIKDDGQRCGRSAPHHRMFADHIKELKDGGAPFDPANGRCLCGSHHTRKTAAARAARFAKG